MPIHGLTVRQLIEQLQQYPDELLVIVNSYENGYDPVTDVSSRHIQATPDRQWWDGVYEPADATGQRVVLIASQYYQTDIE